MTIELYIDNARRSSHCLAWAVKTARENQPYPKTADWYWRLADRFRLQRDEYFACARVIKPKRRKAA